MVVRAGASEARLKLTEAGRKTLEPILGEKCVALSTVDVIMLDPGGGKSEVVSVKTNDCPVARFTVNEAIGTLASVP